MMKRKNLENKNNESTMFGRVEMNNLNYVLFEIISSIYMNDTSLTTKHKRKKEK